MQAPVFLGGEENRRRQERVRSGFLRCAAHHETASSFGRNDGSLFEWEGTDNSNNKSGFGWLTVYIPPIAKGAMDGAPGRLWLIVGEQATTTAKANAGVLRSAQNDNGFGSG
jgi:hypothetical protein